MSEISGIWPSEVTNQTTKKTEYAIDVYYDGSTDHSEKWIFGSNRTMWTNVVKTITGSGFVRIYKSCA